MRPHRFTFDDGPNRWRVGVVWGVADDVCTLKIHRGPGDEPLYQVARELVPNPRLGNPICVRMVGDGAVNLTIEEIRATTWGPDGGPLGDQEGAVARGQFYLAIIPREITNETAEYEWTAGNT